MEGEVSKLGNSFLQTWQRTHLKLYPNRLEFYPKKSDGQINKKTGVEVRFIKSYENYARPKARFWKLVLFSAPT